ncbi:MAG: Chemotaxis protein methyltransferase CheR, partial [uncultured Sphingomonadaceae bacterium]
GSERRRLPATRRPAGAADGPAADDQPPLADRDRVEGLDAVARDRHAGRADRGAGRRRAAAARRRGGRGAAQQRDLFLSRPCAVRPAARQRAARDPRDARGDAPHIDLVRGRVDRAGGLLPRHDYRRGPRPVARMEGRDPGHGRVAGRDRPGARRRLFAVRGAARFADHPDGPLVRAAWRGMAHREVPRPRRPVPGAFDPGAAAASRDLRPDPVPEPDALLHRRRAPSGVFAVGGGHRPRRDADAGRGRDGDRSDGPFRRRPAGARALPRVARNDGQVGAARRGGPI